MKGPNSNIKLSLGASLVVSWLMTVSSGDKTSAAKSALSSSRSRDSMGKLDTLKRSSVQTSTTTGSWLSADWIARATESDSAEEPTNRTGRGFTDGTDRFLCRRRRANSRAMFLHNLGLESAMLVNAMAETRAMTTSSSETADADRRCAGSTIAISPMCWRAVLTAISRPLTWIETVPDKMKQMSLSGNDSSIMVEPGANPSSPT